MSVVFENHLFQIWKVDLQKWKPSPNKRQTTLRLDRAWGRTPLADVIET